MATVGTLGQGLELSQSVNLNRRATTLLESVNTMTNAVAKIDVNDDDFMRGLVSFEDISKAFGGEIVDAASMLGDGFELLKDKNLLVGVPLIVVKHKQASGDHGQFSAAHIVTEKGDRYVIVDGSTGIHAQLVKYAASPHAGKPILLKNGLTRSDYEYTDEKTGELKPATTFYLSY